MLPIFTKRVRSSSSCVGCWALGDGRCRLQSAEVVKVVLPVEGGGVALGFDSANEPLCVRESSPPETRGTTVAGSNQNRLRTALAVEPPPVVLTKTSLTCPLSRHTSQLPCEREQEVLKNIYAVPATISRLRLGYISRTILMAIWQAMQISC